MALQLMPRLLSSALKITGEKRTALILVATSGDTGKAALEGFRDVEGVKIMVFYPVDGVSKIQKLQMMTQEGKNVCVCAIRGNFDDAQNGVKRIFSDSEAQHALAECNSFFSSANSINWGRLGSPDRLLYFCILRSCQQWDDSEWRGNQHQCADGEFRKYLCRLSGKGNGTAG